MPRRVKRMPGGTVAAGARPRRATSPAFHAGWSQTAPPAPGNKSPCVQMRSNNVLPAGAEKRLGADGFRVRDLAMELEIVELEVRHRVRHRRVADRRRDGARRADRLPRQHLRVDHDVAGDGGKIACNACDRNASPTTCSSTTDVRPSEIRSGSMLITVPAAAARTGAPMRYSISQPGMAVLGVAAAVIAERDQSERGIGRIDAVDWHRDAEHARHRGRQRRRGRQAATAPAIGVGGSGRLSKSQPMTKQPAATMSTTRTCICRTSYPHLPAGGAIPVVWHCR